MIDQYSHQGYGKEALCVVFQHWMVPDLGWQPDFLQERTAILQQNLTEFFSKINDSSYSIADLKDSLSNGVAFRVTSSIKEWAFQNLNGLYSAAQSGQSVSS